MAIYFISETYLKETTALSANIDISDIAPFIPTYQDMYIQDTLGTAFYRQIWASYSAQTLNANEIELMERIKPALAWGAAQSALPSITYRATAKGPQTRSGDFSAPITLEELTYLRNEYTNKAEFYLERLKSFLCLSGSSFPGYINNNNIDMRPNKETAYECDIVLNTRPLCSCGYQYCNCAGGYFY